MKHTFTVVYALLGGLYIALMGQLSGFVGAGIKALPIFLLMFLAAIRLSGTWRTGMLVALIFSAGGDILLALDGLFIVGLGSFLVAQLVYAGLFWTHRSSDSGRAGLAVVAFVFMAVAGMFIVPFTGEMQAPVMAYVLAIGAMLMGAAICERPVNKLFVGALFFAVSDLLIAVNTFIVPFAGEGLVVMTTYYLAQYFILSGVLSGPEKS